MSSGSFINADILTVPTRVAETSFGYDPITGELFKVITFDTKITHPFTSTGTCTSGNTNLQYITNHEFGHFAGLDHPSTTPAAGETMMDPDCNPDYTQIKQGDINQINELYLMPFWLVQIADWWSTDEIADYEYLNNINFMVEAALLPGIDTTDITPDAVPEIPVWLKNNAG